MWLPHHSIPNVTRDAGTPPGPGISAFHTPYTSMVPLMVSDVEDSIPVMLKIVSQTQDRANISSFPREERRSQKGYNSASVLSERAKQLCCLGTGPRCHLSLPAPASEVAHSLIDARRWVGNIKSKGLKASDCTEDESPCSTGAHGVKRARRSGLQGLGFSD